MSSTPQFQSSVSVKMKETRALLSRLFKAWGHSMQFIAPWYADITLINDRIYDLLALLSRLFIIPNNNPVEGKTTTVVLTMTI